MKNWWRHDEELMKNWWRTGEELMMKWWRIDEDMMKGWWRTDEELMMKWWRIDDDMMKSWWRTVNPVGTKSQVCPIFLSIIDNQCGSQTFQILIYSQNVVFLICLRSESIKRIDKLCVWLFKQSPSFTLLLLLLANLPIKNDTYHIVVGRSVMVSDQIFHWSQLQKVTCFSYVITNSKLEHYKFCFQKTPLQDIGKIILKTWWKGNIRLI